MHMGASTHQLCDFKSSLSCRVNSWGVEMIQVETCKVLLHSGPGLAVILVAE